jgi:hypothetical protein
MKINGLPNDKLAPTAIQDERTTKKIQDFVASIRSLVAEMLERVRTMESEAGFVVQDARTHVRDEDFQDDLRLLGYTCEAELLQIEETADQLLGLVDRLGRKAKSDAARAERFTRKRKNTARDSDIVRLHDERDLSFGQIAKQLRITYDAARKAYHRHKAAMSNSPGRTDRVVRNRTRRVVRGSSPDNSTCPDR